MIGQSETRDSVDWSLLGTILHEYVCLKVWF